MRQEGHVRVRDAIVWLVVTVIVAGATARLSAPASPGEGTDEVPALTTAQRAVVTVSRRPIASGLTLDGKVLKVAEAFEIVAPVEPIEAAYRLIKKPPEIKATIKGGPAGFSCKYAGLAAGDEGLDDGVGLRCRVPARIRLVEGLPARLEVQLESPVQALVLPRTAVIGDGPEAQVLVVKGGTGYEARDVRLGRTDGKYVEVRSGVSEGERVLEHPVQSDLDNA